MTTVTYDPWPVIGKLSGLDWSDQRGKGKAKCPAHEDRTASLTLAIGREHGGLVLFCHAGCGRLDILDAIGCTVYDLFPPRDQQVAPTFTQRQPAEDTWMPCGFDGDRQPIPGHGKVAEYLYQDADGTTVFGVARCKGKGVPRPDDPTRSICQGFRQWRPNPSNRSGRSWSVTLEDGTKVGEGLPYRLPELLRAIELGNNVWIVGGEKDAERLRSLGYAATCNAGGETTDNGGRSKWTPAHAEWLAGADVMIVADRDETGRRWAEAVVSTLVPLARSIEVFQAAIGNDVSDHFDAEGPEVTAYLETQGRHLDVHGQPITRLGLHHFVQVGEPIAAPVPVPGCNDCAVNA